MQLFMYKINICLEVHKLATILWFCNMIHSSSYSMLYHEIVYLVWDSYTSAWKYPGEMILLYLFIPCCVSLPIQVPRRSLPAVVPCNRGEDICNVDMHQDCDEESAGAVLNCHSNISLDVQMAAEPHNSNMGREYPPEVQYDEILLWVTENDAEHERGRKPVQ